MIWMILKWFKEQVEAKTSDRVHLINAQNFAYYISGLEIFTI